MIDITKVRAEVEAFIEGTEAFIVDVHSDADNNVTVAIDSPKGVDLEMCEALNRRLQTLLDGTPQADDYSLEVGSAGLSAPLTVAGQYEKFCGEPVVVATRDGRKVRGVLKSHTVDPDGTITFTVMTTRREKPEGAKRPVNVEADESFRLPDVNSVHYDF